MLFKTIKYIHVRWQPVISFGHLRQVTYDLHTYSTRPQRSSHSCAGKELFSCVASSMLFKTIKYIHVRWQPVISFGHLRQVTYDLHTSTVEPQCDSRSCAGRNPCCLNLSSISELRIIVTQFGRLLRPSTSSG